MNKSHDLFAYAYNQSCFWVRWIAKPAPSPRHSLGCWGDTMQICKTQEHLSPIVKVVFNNIGNRSFGHWVILFHCNRFCQIARLVHIRPFGKSCVIGQKLRWNCIKDGGDHLVNIGHFDPDPDVVPCALEACAIGQ